AVLLPWEEPTWNVVSEEKGEWIKRATSLSKERFVKLIECTNSWLDKIPNDAKYKAGLYDLACRYHRIMSSREDEFPDLIFDTICGLEDLILDVWVERDCVPVKRAGQSPSSATPSMPSSNTVGESDA